LPQPDGPTNEMNSPSAIDKLTPLRTFVWPNDFTILLSVIFATDR